MSWYYGGGALPPSFVGLVQLFSAYSSSNSAIVLTGAVAAGNRVVLLAVGANGARISSVSDTRGNTYTVDTYAGNDGTATQRVSMASAHVGTALQVGDTITVVWSDANFQGKNIYVCNLANCASTGQPNVTKARTVFAQLVSEAASTTETNTVAIGIISIGGAGTYSGGSWTTIGTTDYSGRRVYAIYSVLSSSGSQNPSGTWNAANGQANCWAAYD